MVKKYSAPSVNKAFEILKAISSTKKGMGVSEIATDLHIAKSTVHGITSALEELGAVIRNPSTKRYTLGFTLFELGQSAYSHIDRKALSRPIMEKLMERTQESVFYGTLNSDRVTILDKVESGHDMKITSPVGSSLPLLAGAVGKVFLAGMEESQARRIIRAQGLTRYTDNSITDVDRYISELRRVKKQGYAVDNEEYILGVRAVAAPVKGDWQEMSAIWVVGFKTSVDDLKMEALIEQTGEAAKAISMKIEKDAFVND